ncbi:MAG: PQQ-binding-like beta-propeller repeat protein, partial [Patescibacteria group bacterium]|nr:PQQ-binding-like beta-propeller repeat protein [Patescibacteria group bacterium]
ETASAGSPLAPLPSKRKGWFGWLRRGRAGAPRRRESVWESPILLISGGLLVGLLILGTVLLWTLGRQSGDEALTAANEEYRAGSYTQAIHKFDQFLDRFPNHGGASRARVTRGIAQLRQATAAGAGANWPAALVEVQRVLKDIQPEAAFSESSGELAAMLPAIAEGLAARARETIDSDVLQQAREALELAGNRMIVPTRLQPTAKLAEIEAQLALADRQIHQGVELDAAISAITKAIAQEDTKLAYDIHRELLQKYPALVDNAKLAAVTVAISIAQRSAVKAAEDVIAADASPAASFAWTSVALAERLTKEPLPGGDDTVFVAVIGGSAYGFEAARGRLLWQTHLGVANDGFRAPVAAVPASADAAADWFVVSPAANELWRLAASTGQPRWRLPLGEPMDAAPVLADERLLVAVTRAGRLHLINPESGESVRQIVLPQAVSVAPAVDAQRGLIYQPADHSNLFVLETASGRCLDVVHMGHAPGSISASPVLAADVLLVPINDRARTATLRVYGVPDEMTANMPPEAGGEASSRANLLRELQAFRVRGQFDTSPVVVDRSVVAITDLGAVHAYELSAADREKPLV